MRRAVLSAGVSLLLVSVVQYTATAPAAWAVLGNHVVQPGETLYCIGRAYGVSPWAIAAHNGVLNPNLIYPGLSLAIPDAYATLPPGPVCTRQFGEAPPGPCSCTSTYTIVRGDTLTRISLTFGVNMWRIAECNGIRNLNYIRAGDTLCIPELLPGPTPVPPTPTPSPTATATSTPLAPTTEPTSTPEPSTATAVPPSATPSPTPTAVSAEGPLIAYFRANVTEADPGDTITLEWQSTGGTRATVYSILPTGQYSTWWDVEPTGAMDYAIHPDYRNAVRFQLFVFDDADRRADAWLSIPLRCPDTWFFSPPPDECPSGPPVLSDGAEQHFEHGVMLWNGAENRIYVLYDDESYPDWQAFTDEWSEGDPPSDPGIVPPAGLYQPVRGFGLVWREQPNVRERLGWGTDQEAGYETAIQRTSRFKYNEIYIKALDGGVWRLGPEGSEWNHIP